MSLDKNKFGECAAGWKFLHDPLDSAPLVARRYDDGKRGMRASMARYRARYRVMNETEPRERPEIGKKGVAECGKQRNVFWQKHLRSGLHDFETGKLEKVPEIKRREPVLLDRRGAQMKQRCQTKHRLPQRAVLRYDKPPILCHVRSHLGKDFFDVVYVPQHIAQDDVISRLYAGEIGQRIIDEYPAFPLRNDKINQCIEVLVVEAVLLLEVCPLVFFLSKIALYRFVCPHAYTRASMLPERVR